MRYDNAVLPIIHSLQSLISIIGSLSHSHMHGLLVVSIFPFRTIPIPHLPSPSPNPFYIRSYIHSTYLKRSVYLIPAYIPYIPPLLTCESHSPAMAPSCLTASFPLLFVVYILVIPCPSLHSCELWNGSTLNGERVGRNINGRSRRTGRHVH